MGLLVVAKEEREWMEGLWRTSGVESEEFKKAGLGLESLIRVSLDSREGTKRIGD